MKRRLTLGERAAGLAYGAAFKLAGNNRDAGIYFTAAINGQWDGGQASRHRAYPGTRLASQDVDLNYGRREDLLSDARQLQQTEPVAKRIVNQYADYCIGTCRARWNTGDESVDAAYRANWDYRMKVLDYRGIHQFPKLMKLAVGSGLIGDGGMFVQECLEKNSMTPTVNLIEYDRVSSSGIFNFDTDEMVGGIGLDPLTRRQQFIRVWQRTIYGTFINPIEIRKPEFLHLFDPARVDASKGVTGFHAVLNATRDKYEINKAETLKTKRNSKLALIASVISGQMPATQPTIDLYSDAPLQQTIGPQVAGVETLGDAATYYKFPTEDVKAHENPNASTAMQHLEFIIRNIALGVNLPFGVVWNMAGLGKPGVLFELEQAARTIAAVQDEIENRLIIPIIAWVTSVDMTAGRIPFNANWYKFQVARPSYISIDAGRDSKSAIAENLMAMKSATRWYEESGDDFEEETELCFKEQAFRHKLAKQYDVPLVEVRQTTPNANMNAQGDSDKQSQGD